MFFVLSDDHIGSTPKPAPGSQVEPSGNGANANESDDVVVDMEVSGGTVTTPGSKSQGGISSQLKRKAGDVFSGTSKQTKQTAPSSLN